MWISESIRTQTYIPTWLYIQCSLPTESCLWGRKITQSQQNYSISSFSFYLKSILIIFYCKINSQFIYSILRFFLGMSISSVNGDPREDYPVWRFEVGEFFPVGMRIDVKVPRKRFGEGDGISSSAPRRLRPRKLIK
jgi:hypothetical protein